MKYLQVRDRVLDQLAAMAPGEPLPPERELAARLGVEKLWRRGQRIVAEVTGADAAEADKLLGAADGQVKTAIVALLSGVGVDEARERLACAHGRVRDAVGKAGLQ
jgi:N-acetylmuramic acid 6-phosphate (MurNAc-6-P) etherase